MPLKRALESLNLGMRRSTCIWLQKGQNAKVLWVDIGRLRQPNLLTPKTRKMVMAPLVCLSGHVWWCIVLLEGEWLFLEVYFGCYEGRSFNVWSCVHFCTLWHKDEGRLLCFGNSSPHQDRKRLLSSEHHSEVFARTVILLVKSCLNIKQFLSEKMTSLVSLPAFILLRIIFARASLLFLEVCEFTFSEVTTSNWF